MPQQLQTCERQERARIGGPDKIIFFPVLNSTKPRASQDPRRTKKYPRLVFVAQATVLMWCESQVPSPTTNFNLNWLTLKMETLLGFLAERIEKLFWRKENLCSNLPVHRVGRRKNPPFSRQRFYCGPRMASAHSLFHPSWKGAKSKAATTFNDAADWRSWRN